MFLALFPFLLTAIAVFAELLCDNFCPMICSPNGVCECRGDENIRCLRDAEEPNENAVDIPTESSFCLPSEVEKNGKCYIRRKPGEACDYSEQCMNVGDIEYYCIANVCQEPPECPPGFVAMGAECLPYSVTGGPCIHPSQCLTGSVCIKGKCRGPCDFNQLFLEESCVDYEGAGCIATSCMSSKCPRAFPSCNFVTQKRDYLCCDRSLETKVQCPLPHSEPLLDKETGSVVECMYRPCMANYRCVFASYGRGKYICCSKPKAPKRPSDMLTSEMTEEEEEWTTTQSSSLVPPPPRPVPGTWRPSSTEPTPQWTTTAAPWYPNTNNVPTPPISPNGGWGANNGWNPYMNGWNGGWNGNRGYGQNWNAASWTPNNAYGATNWGYYPNNNNNNWNAYPVSLRRRRIRPLHRSTFSRIGRPRSYAPPYPGILNESDIETPAITDALSSASITPSQPIGVVYSAWPYAVRVLVFWCCNNRSCTYRDHLEKFCRRVLHQQLTSQYSPTKYFRSVPKTNRQPSDMREARRPIERTDPHSFPISSDTNSTTQ